MTTNHPAPVEPATSIDALLSPAGPYETGPDAGNADGAQLVRDRHGNSIWWAPVCGCDSLDELLSRIRARILPHLRPPANHFPGATEMVAPPAEGEVQLLAAWMHRLADERTRNRRRGIRPHPNALTRTGAVIQQQAAVIQQQAAELAECREALRRVRRWGSTFGSHYSSAVAMGVMDWIDAGMTGPLPAMPEYLEGRPNG